jgi:tetratricopeptide (TPR) repeat protein
MADPQFKTAKDLVMTLQRAKGDPEKSDWGRAIFLIGAGCSRSAGIPLGSEIAKCCVKRLAHVYSNGTLTFATANEFIPVEAEAGETDAKNALRLLADKHEAFKPWKDTKPDWGRIYNEVFENDFKAPPEQRQIISAAVKCCHAQVNWAHLCLGELVRRGYVHTVLTTNFDQLVLQGILRTGVLPVIADGIESLNRISSQPQLPQVVHIHGSMHTYNPRNSRTAVVETQSDLGLQGSMYTLLKDANVLVVLGYAGGEEGVMQLLIQAAEKLPDTVIYWAIRGQDINVESKYMRNLLGKGRNKYIIPDCDADKLFAEIMAGLGIGVPQWIQDPVKQLEGQADTIADNSNSDVQKLIISYRQTIQELRTSAGRKPLSIEVQRAAVAALRLEGKHKEALDMLNTFGKVDDPDLLKMWVGSSLEFGVISDEPFWLEESVRVCRLFLSKFTKADQPDLWAMAQNKLGTALRNLGRREKGTTRLEEATAAHRAALEVYTFERAPFDWAMTQDNLGDTLTDLGKREAGGTRLEQAVVAYRAALQVYTRQQFSMNWSLTQNSLGDALVALGLREQGTARLGEGVAAFRAALEVQTRERIPTSWAMTQNSLGNVLQSLGEREEGTTRLEEAVAAHRAALEVLTRERLPLGWAFTQTNLGNALRILGEREEGATRLEEAVVAYRAALEVYRQAKREDFIGSVTRYLQIAEEKLNDRQEKFAQTKQQEPPTA